MNEILRRILTLIDTPDDVADAKERARLRLREHIAASTPSSASPFAHADGRYGRHRLSRFWMPAGAAAVVAIVVSIGILIGVSTPEATAIDELAYTVVVLPDEALHDVDTESHASTRSLSVVMADPQDSDAKNLVYFVSADIARRQSTAGVVQITRTVTSIEYLGDVDQATADRVEADLEIGVPETVTQPLSVRYYEEEALITDDPDVLEQRIDELIDRYGDPAIDDDIETFRWILNLHRTHSLTPAERSATLTVLGRLDNVKSRRVGTDVVAVVEYATPDGREVLSASFNPEGWLVEETLTALDGVPGLVAGETLRSTAIYAPPSVAP
ncbi:MAG: hypothetical protein U9N78_08215 [Actinomycetota bacterium]|nr:hypothetical protein [Actinomycetota bacterium]